MSGVTSAAKWGRPGGGLRARSRVLVVWLLSLTVVAAACTSGDSSDEPTTPSSSATSTVTSPTVTTTTDIGTAPTLDDQIGWVLGLLNGGTTNVDEVAAQFADVFLAQVPPEQFLAVVEQLRGDVSESWTAPDAVGDETGAEVRLTTESGPWVMFIALGGDGSIETLLFQPETFTVEDPPETFDQLSLRLMELGEVALLVADVSDGTCQPIHAVQATTPQPIASNFKLYVLGALVNAIATGDVAWDDALAIQDDLKSLPSGTFQDLEDGTERTVEEFAQMMIAISDNTATDHLIDLLGRERVEVAQSVYGHADPGLNRPFLTTRELFVLKLAFSPAERDAYISAGPDARRTILETDVAERDVSVEDAADWTTPRHIEELEWFASPTDLCRAMIVHQANAADPALAPVRQILSANPGVPIDTDLWTYVGFKGGSEPGVLSLAWYLEGASGKFVYAIAVTNAETVISEPEAIALAAVGLDLLADS